MNRIAFVKAGSELGLPGITSTRLGDGASVAPYDSFNVGDHVGDHEEAVAINRSRLAATIGLERLCWINQVHGTEIVEARRGGDNPTADGLWTREPNLGVCVMTADCLPIFVAGDRGDLAGMIHGGWRSLAGGIVQNFAKIHHAYPGRLKAWIGPGISKAHYTVGVDFQRFMTTEYGSELAQRIVSYEDGCLRADLVELARVSLEQAGIEYLGCSGLCTYADDQFYSYRRAGERADQTDGPKGVTGRMASVIWIPQ